MSNLLANLGQEARFWTDPPHLRKQRPKRAARAKLMRDAEKEIARLRSVLIEIAADKPDVTTLGLAQIARAALAERWRPMERFVQHRYGFNADDIKVALMRELDGLHGIRPPGGASVKMTLTATGATIEWQEESES